jgi:FkbM family methyltransferase
MASEGVVFSTAGAIPATVCGSILQHLLDMRLKAWRRLHERGRLWRHFVAKFLVASRLSRRLFIQRPGYRLRFNRSALSTTLWVNPNEHEFEERLLSRYLRPGDCVIDVGANIGSLTLAAALTVGPTGRVVAMEPHPRTCKHLRDNLSLNGIEHVDVHNVACGNRRGHIRFSDNRSDEQNRVEDGADLVDGTVIDVALMRLDDLVGSVGGVALLKIDVEGYEKQVLEGATQLLKRTEAVLFESWEGHSSRYGYATSDVLSVLRTYGFEVFHVGDEFDLMPVGDGYASQGCENLLALRPSATHRFSISGEYELLDGAGRTSLTADPKLESDAGAGPAM